MLGRLKDLRHIVQEHNVEAIVIAIPSLPPAKLSALVREAADTGAHVRFLPSFLSALERAARAVDMRVVNFNNLLGRQERRNLRPARKVSARARSTYLFSQHLLLRNSHQGKGSKQQYQLRSSQAVDF